GASWSKIDFNIPERGSRSQFLVDGNDLYALEDYKPIYRSSDNGMSWKEINPSGPYRPSEIDGGLEGFAAGHGLLLASYSSYGIYLCRDQGKTCYPIRKGFRDYEIYPDFTYHGFYKMAINNTHLFAIQNEILFSRPQR